jgi:hypothetical protein
MLGPITFGYLRFTKYPFGIGPLQYLVDNITRDLMADMADAADPVRPRTDPVRSRYRTPSGCSASGR